MSLCLQCPLIFSLPQQTHSYPTRSNLLVTCSRGIFHEWPDLDLCSSLCFPSPCPLCHSSGSTSLARSSTPLTLCFNSASLGPNTWHDQSCYTMCGQLVVDKWGFPLKTTTTISICMMITWEYTFVKFLKFYTYDLCNFLCTLYLDKALLT